MKRKVIVLISLLALVLLVAGCTQQEAEEKVELTDDAGNIVGEAFKYAPAKYRVSELVPKSQCAVTSTCRTINQGDLLVIGEGQTLNNIRGFASELRVDVDPDGRGAAFTICNVQESVVDLNEEGNNESEEIIESEEERELPADDCQEFELRLCETKKVGEDNVQLVAVVGESAVLIAG